MKDRMAADPGAGGPARLPSLLALSLPRAPAGQRGLPAPYPGRRRASAACPRLTPGAGGPARPSRALPRAPVGQRARGAGSEAFPRFHSLLALSSIVMLPSPLALPSRSCSSFGKARPAFKPWHGTVPEAPKDAAEVRRKPPENLQLLSAVELTRARDRTRRETMRQRDYEP